jgi:hypothetical protein
MTKKKMKIKYKYGVYNLLDSYPTEEDALFEIHNYLKERKREAEEWSDKGIKPAFSKKLSESTITELLDSLVSQGFLKKREGAGKRNYFTILKTPF